MSTKNQVQEAENQVAKLNPDRGAVVYQVAGQDVKLSYKIVRDFLTKGNGDVSDQDLTQFISICKYNQLNPFLNEAYLVKFGAQPAQMIVSKEAFFKRADANPNYQGFRAGIIIQRDNQILELEGTFKLKSDVLLGGWAEIHRDDKKFPIVAKVALDEYDKKQSVWNEKKSTMIAKIAKVQALREAFPAQLGAMYTQEEQAETIEAEYQVVDKKVATEITENANAEVIEFTDEKSEPKIPTASPEIAFPTDDSKPGF
ncbi:phage recombination protein Bet [Soonwooa purpurea]